MTDAPLDERLAALALAFYERAWKEGTTPSADREFIRDHAASLEGFAAQARDEYVRVKNGDASNEGLDVPTNAQGIALARFLRPHFRNARPGDAHAQVMRGGLGLPTNYLAVRLPDGYEGGIAPNGDTST